MTTIDSAATRLRGWGGDGASDEARLAVAAFLARYSGRTLDAYRHDLRGFFQWSADVGLIVSATTRTHIELYRGWMEGPRLGGLDDRPATVDRVRLLPVRAHRRAHPVEPRPVRPPTEGAAKRGPRHGIAANLAPSCSPPNASITPTPRLACSSG